MSQVGHTARTAHNTVVPLGTSMFPMRASLTALRGTVATDAFTLSDSCAIATATWLREITCSHRSSFPIFEMFQDSGCQQHMHQHKVPEHSTQHTRRTTYQQRTAAWALLSHLRALQQRCSVRTAVNFGQV